MSDKKKTEQKPTAEKPAAKPAETTAVAKKDDGVVKPQVMPPVLNRAQLVVYKDLNELVRQYRGVEVGMCRSALKGIWWLGFQVDAVLNKAAYGDCGMAKLVETLYADLPEAERKNKHKSLYLYAKFNQAYEWDDVESRLIKHRIPLRTIERFLAIKDPKDRKMVEDAVIAGTPIQQALEDAGLKKPATKQLEEGSVLDEDGEAADETKDDKKVSTPLAGKVMKALASVEAQGGLFKGALAGLSKSLQGYDTGCTDAKDRKAVTAELARVMDEILLELPDTLQEVIDDVKRNQDA